MTQIQPFAMTQNDYMNALFYLLGVVGVSYALYWVLKQTKITRVRKRYQRSTAAYLRYPVGRHEVEYRTRR